jgi:hypothetical protein
MPSLLKNVKMYYVYDKYDNVTQYLRCQVDKMCDDMKVTKGALISMITRHEHLKKYELFKMTNDDELEQII